MLLLKFYIVIRFIFHVIRRQKRALHSRNTCKSRVIEKFLRTGETFWSRFIYIHTLAYVRTYTQPLMVSAIMLVSQVRIIVGA